jgi:gliding motility-associated lipoprotein GldH
MIRPLFSILFVLLICISCNENRLYEAHIDPEGELEWNRGDALIFDVEIIDTTIKYNQLISFRHAIGYAYSACSLKIVEKAPDGAIVEYHVTLPIADSEGYKGDCHGDICDLEVSWLEKREFNSTGIYHYEITHEMTEDQIHMVMLVGMILDKSGSNGL